MKQITLLITLLALGVTTNASSLKKGSVICTSNGSFLEMVAAASSNDERGVNYLLTQQRCIMTAKEVHISILGRGPDTIKIRAYNGDNAVVVWTHETFIKD
jgi:hypothetical protein